MPFATKVRTALEYGVKYPFGRIRPCPGGLAEAQKLARKGTWYGAKLQVVCREVTPWATR